MARVTVEDCLENVDNRFELVMLATKRARQLATGGKEPKVAWENDKPTVVALREIAGGLVDEAVIAEEELIEEEPIFSTFDEKAKDEALRSCASEEIRSRCRCSMLTAGGAAMAGNVEALADRISSYLAADQVNLVRRAYYYAEQAHDGQRRRSGEAYVTHPLAVANILADMHMDHQSLMAAMLHDVIEDTGIAKEAISAQFGETVAELVDGVSKLTQMKFENKAEAQAENFQKMALAMARDIRVILVKLADRLHNMRTLDAMPPEKSRRIARETLEIYAPIANRLGMHKLSTEFEDLGFKAMYPMRSRMIAQAVRDARGNRKELLNQILESLQACLERAGLPGTVVGREKHLYSIYEKMREKRRAFNEIMDVYAFRIIVDKVDTCYRVLGAVHGLYKPFPGRFKDYIAIPKANGYQSLHTTLFGLHGVPIEIQIRTEEMEEMANN